MSKKDGDQRQEIFDYARQKYGSEPDYPWSSYPTYAALRHTDSKKWYALLMTVRGSALGLPSDERVEILNLKCDPLLKGSLLMKEGFLPAYHMNKGSWITVCLDRGVETEEILTLLDMSYELTGAKARNQKDTLRRISHWIVPANPRYFDIESAFEASDEILWKQSSSIEVGDTVYMYVAAPYSAIRYKCEAVEVKIPYRYQSEKVRMKYLMKIRKIRKI